MKRTFLVSAALLLSVAACGPLAAPPTPPTETSPLTATATATRVPPTATPEPSPTADPLLFRDDFDGALGEGWHWLREKPRYWSLTATPGWLQIVARAGTFFYGDITNVLLRDAPAGDFELETRVNFRPGGNYQFAGLVIYDDAKNTVTFGRAFCDNPDCAGDGFYLDMIDGGAMVGENFATKAPAVDVVYLRLRRVGDAFTGLASIDASDWTVIGTHRRVSSPLFVGILAGQAWGSVPKPAQFDYFAMSTVR